MLSTLEDKQLRSWVGYISSIDYLFVTIQRV